MILLTLSLIINWNGQRERSMECILMEDDIVEELFRGTPRVEDLQAWLA